jgi:HMG (high mobility group) box
MAKKEQNAKFKKAPGAPRRFKSAYMFFSTEKHKSIRQDHGKKLQTTEVAKMVSQAWKDLPPEEREEW